MDDTLSTSEVVWMSNDDYVNPTFA